MKIILLLLTLSLFGNGNYWYLENSIQIGTGLLLESSDNTDIGRVPTYLQTDYQYYTEEIPDIKYGIGLGIQMEDGVAFIPSAFIKMSTGKKPIEGFIIAGIEYKVHPETAFGLRTGGGVLYHMKHAALKCELNIRPHLFGEEIGDHMKLYLSMMVGFSLTF